MMDMRSGQEHAILPRHHDQDEEDDNENDEDDEDEMRHWKTLFFPLTDHKCTEFTHTACKRESSKLMLAQNILCSTVCNCWIENVALADADAVTGWIVFLDTQVSLAPTHVRKSVSWLVTLSDFQSLVALLCNSRL